MAANSESDGPASGAPNGHPGARWLLRNEFAAVEVELDLRANSPRLKVVDLRSGRTNHLDPLELERLTAARHADLAWIVSPTNGDTFDAEHPS